MTIYAGIGERIGEGSEPFCALRERLNQLRILAPNWDGRGAAAPSSTAVAFAEAILNAAEAVNLAPDRVVADVEGGVAIYLFGGAVNQRGVHAKQVGIMIGNDGDAAYYCRESGRPAPRAVALGTSSADVRQAIRAVVVFLDGGAAVLR